MLNVTKPWKEFNINLSIVEDWMKTNTTGYCGNSADDSLHFWFTDELSTEEATALNAYWDAITKESEEATSYIPVATIKNAMDAARANAVTKTWNQMSVAQRKLIVGMTPTREDLEL